MDWDKINRKIEECKKLKNTEEQINCLKKLYEETGDGMVAYRLAEIFEEKGELKEALKYYEEAFNRFPDEEWKKRARNARERVIKKLKEANKVCPLCGKDYSYSKIIRECPQAHCPNCGSTNLSKLYRYGIKYLTGSLVESKADLVLLMLALECIFITIVVQPWISLIIIPSVLAGCYAVQRCKDCSFVFLRPIKKVPLSSGSAVINKSKKVCSSCGRDYSFSKIIEKCPLSHCPKCGSTNISSIHETNIYGHLAIILTTGIFCLLMTAAFPPFGILIPVIPVLADYLCYSRKVCKDCGAKFFSAVRNVPVESKDTAQSKAVQPILPSNPETKTTEHLEKPKEIPITDFQPKPTTPKTFPPELADRYEEVEYIGKGGFARVFKAKKNGKLVAIKIPISLDPATGKSFLREIQNWTKLDHENIVKVYDYNILPIPYFEMELCDYSLADVKKPINIARAAWIIFKVAEGLKYAHKFGIIHRDLKPHNIMLKNGIPKISDWGLSKVLSESSPSIASFTPLYAAPEHVSEKFGRVDERTDIWQLGVIFYELVTGKLPFTGNDLTEVAFAIIGKDPLPPSHINPKAKDVEHIILKCLQRDQSKRYQSAGELQRDLAKYLSLKYQESLQLSLNQRDLKRSAFYCSELLLMRMIANDVVGAYKYASDLVNYAKGEVKSLAEELTKQLKIRIDAGMNEIPEELIRKAEVIAHKIRLGFEKL